MTIKNNMTYEPPFKELEKEEEIISLLNDVKNSFCILDASIKLPIHLDEIVSIIDKEVYDIEQNPFLFNSINLSQAKNLLNDYRYKSEGGCQSCQKIKYFKPLPDETLSYCSLSEKQEDAIADMDASSQSERIKQYFQKGCEERKPIFRLLEEVLKNY